MGELWAPQAGLDGARPTNVFWCIPRWKSLSWHSTIDTNLYKDRGRTSGSAPPWSTRLSAWCIAHFQPRRISPSLSATTLYCLVTGARVCYARDLLTGITWLERAGSPTVDLKTASSIRFNHHTTHVYIDKVQWCHYILHRRSPSTGRHVAGQAMCAIWGKIDVPNTSMNRRSSISFKTLAKVPK